MRKRTNRLSEDELYEAQKKVSLKSKKPIDTTKYIPQMKAIQPISLALLKCGEMRYIVIIPGFIFLILARGVMGISGNYNSKPFMGRNTTQLLSSSYRTVIGGKELWKKIEINC